LPFRIVRKTAQKYKLFLELTSGKEKRARKNRETAI
jgi:hypothetical protein